jgi:FixJ family two-component response regulator
MANPDEIATAARAGSALICIVDDDLPLLDALAFSLAADGNRVEIYMSAEALLADLQRVRSSACLVLDEQLPGRSGLDLYAYLTGEIGIAIPAVLITSSPAPRLRQRAAALDVAIVEKPLVDEQLVHAIRKAVAGLAR